MCYIFNQILTINNGDKPIANKIRLDLGKCCLFWQKGSFEVLIFGRNRVEILQQDSFIMFFH